MYKALAFAGREHGSGPRNGTVMEALWYTWGIQSKQESPQLAMLLSDVKRNVQEHNQPWAVKLPL